MIELTRINHAPLILNSELIEHIETTPDTVISLTNGQKLVVLESAMEVKQKVVEFLRSVHARILPECFDASLPDTSLPDTSQAEIEDAQQHTRGTNH